MRVIAGIAKNHRLDTLEGLDTRPTGDRVKEAWFNIINTHIYNASVLDLFSGSGAIGIEALSRGAQRCIFIEQNTGAVKIINKNLENTRLSETAEVIRGDVFSFLKSTNDKYDFIFLDPPYHHELVPATLEIIADKNMLADGGTVVAETDYNENMPENVGCLSLTDKRKYGRALLHFYKYRI